MLISMEIIIINNYSNDIIKYVEDDMRKYENCVKYERLLKLTESNETLSNLCLSVVGVQGQNES